MLTVNDYLAQPVIDPDERIPYGDHSCQFGDLYLAQATQPTPVVVMIHGGCWQAAYDLTPLSACCVDLRARGYTVWSLEIVGSVMVAVGRIRFWTLLPV